MRVNMGLAGKIFRDKKTGITEGYVDLEKYIDTTKSDTGASMHVGIGEIQRYEDIKTFLDYVYNGNILIVDFSPISDEEVILKRITKELKQMVNDINGDLAGIGNNLMIISPSDVKIDRRKIKGNYS